MMADTSGGFCDTPIPAFFGIPDFNDYGITTSWITTGPSV
jgi:hypothetical protein